MKCPSRAQDGRHIRRVRATALSTLLLLTCGAAAQDENVRLGGYFHATFEGPDRVPVVPCHDDPLGLATDPTVASIMQLLMIDPSTVEFSGCTGAQFQVTEKLIGSTERRYQIRYPAQAADTFLGALTHELAHVMQMQAAGGHGAALTDARNEMRRVELGADYLTGLAFFSLKNASSRFGSGQFHHSPELMGLYKEISADAHGTPSQRAAAFRYGFVNKDGQNDLRAAHSYFQNNLYADILRDGAVAPAGPSMNSTGGGQTEIALDKLTACDEISSLLETLSAEHERAACAAADDPITRAILARLGPEARKVCVLAQPPARFLLGFTCFVPPAGGGLDLTCFREANRDAVERYKADYASAAAVASARYLKQASECAASNGDSAPAQLTLMSPYLAFVAKFEFGYIVSLGHANPPDGSMIHGYATTDPALDTEVATIEFVQILAGMQPQKPTGVTRTVGDWTVEIDEGDEPDETLNKAYRLARADAWIDSRGFEFERDTGAPVSQAGKLAWLNRIQDAIGEELESEGFEELDTGSDEEAAEKMQEMFVKMEELQPHGWKDSMPVRISKNVKMYMHDDRARCSGPRESGMIGVFVFVFQPRPGVRKDFGGVTTAVFAAGTCKTTFRAVGAYAESLLGLATERVFQKLKTP